MDLMVRAYAERGDAEHDGDHLAGLIAAAVGVHRRRRGDRSAGRVASGSRGAAFGYPTSRANTSAIVSTWSLKTASSLGFLNFGQAFLINGGLVVVMAMAAIGVGNGARTCSNSPCVEDCRWLRGTTPSICS